MSLEVALDLQVGTFELDIAFEATDGITALFGPSGAGKTLTLRCIAGLMRPRRGHIVSSGRVLLDTGTGIDVPARRRGIGYVFQQYALFPHLNVEKNIAYGITHLDRAARAERVAAGIALVGLEGLQHRRVSELSGGQQQRVALARALATQPDLLLLDEPFAAVDLRARRALRAELRRIQQATRTPMLIVTHDLAEVRQLSDYLVLVDRGRVHRAGPTSSILADSDDPLLYELLEEGLG